VVKWQLVVLFIVLFVHVEGIMSNKWPTYLTFLAHINLLNLTAKSATRGFSHKPAADGAPLLFITHHYHYHTIIADMFQSAYLVSHLMLVMTTKYA